MWCFHICLLGRTSGGRTLSHQELPVARGPYDEDHGSSETSSLNLTSTFAMEKQLVLIEFSCKYIVNIKSSKLPEKTSVINTGNKRNVARVNIFREQIKHIITVFSCFDYDIAHYFGEEKKP